MPELSSLIRQRMQAGEDLRLQHPDADTLTAYVEKLLSAKERSLVLDHIAVCGDCREIVFLATPENAAVAGPEALVPEAAGAPRRRWFLTPTFGLVASIAAMAVAITLVIELPNKSPRTSTTQAQNTQAQNNQVQNTQAQTGASPQPAVQSAVNSAPAADALSASASSASIPAAPVASAAKQSNPTVDRETTLRASAVPPAVSPERSRTVANNLAANKDQSVAKTAPALTASLTKPAAPPPQPAATTETLAVNGAAAAPVLEAKANRQDYLNAQRFQRDLADSAGSSASLANLPLGPAPAFNGQPNSGVVSNGFASNGPAKPSLFSGGLQQSTNAYLITPEQQQQASQGVMTFTPRGPEHPSLLSKIVDVGKRPIVKHVEPSLRASNVSRFAMTFNGPAGVHAEAVPANNATDAAVSNLANSPAFTAGGVGSAKKSFAGASAAYRWKVLQGKLLRSADSAVWIEGYSTSNEIEFSAVSATGSDVWAGGNRGQLVHSRDAGLTWEKVALGEGEIGNIVSIANNGMHIKVTTAPSQGWSSIDGGKTWIKLP